MRTAYRCRAYPDQEQQAALNRTFGCVRVVWNRTLAAFQARSRLEGTGTSYTESDRTLTVMKKDPDLAFLNEVSCVPLQQALRHQHQAFRAFFAKRARYPRFKSRRSRRRRIGHPRDSVPARQDLGCAVTFSGRVLPQAAVMRDALIIGLLLATPAAVILASATLALMAGRLRSRPRQATLR